MKRIQHIILFAALSLCFTSCLEKYPKDSVLESDTMQSLSDAEQILNGIYATFKSSSLYTGDIVVAQDIQADLVYAVDGFSNTYGDIWEWNIKSDNSTITGVYATLYNIIGKCNFFLEYASQVEASIVKEEDFSTFDLYVGEVHFARAFAYSELARIFCEAYDESIADVENSGMVLSTTYSVEAQPIRSTLRETYDLILADLAIAEEQIGSDANNAIFFTEGTVEALYARVYLHMQNWSEAAEYATRVIERSSTYALAPSTSYESTTGYSELYYMWTYDSSYEIIWKVGLTINSLGGGIGQVFLNYNYVTYLPDYVPAAWVLNSYSSGDGRYSAYFMTATTGYSHGLTWPLLSKYKGNETFLASNVLYVHMPKVFRLAEQYLIRAEAYAAMGNYSKASSDLTSITVARCGSGTVTVNADNWLSKISEERSKELFMEGFRLSDLKRWGMGFERKAQSNTVSTSNTLKIEAGDYRFVWPIPNHEIEAPGSQIVQNSGY
ncbi:MAG: RagB/SusD family nutrient uptake outer membrane protein [Rikenellaceae bacterium]